MRRFPARWCANLSLHCFGAGLGIVDAEAQRIGASRWIGVFTLRAVAPVAEPPSLDLLRMATRRPQLAPVDVVLDAFAVELSSAIPRELRVRIAAPDRLGLLAALFERFDALGLEPTRVSVATLGGLAVDAFRLAGRPGTRLGRPAAQRLEASLREVCRKR